MNTADYPTTKEVERIKYDIEMLYRNYNLCEDRFKQYNVYVYDILHYTLLFYIGLITIFAAFPEISPTTRVTETLIFVYALPIITYIFGLFYAFNSVILYHVLEKQIEIAIKIEKCAEKIHHKSLQNEWAAKGDYRANTTGYMLAYGTMLMFYIVIPLGMILSLIFFYEWEKDSFYWIFQIALPFLLYLVYFIFIGILIRKMFVMKKRVKELSNQKTDKKVR